MGIRNKIAVITGAASGLGEKTAEKLIQAGFKVAMLDLNQDIHSIAKKINDGVDKNNGVGKGESALGFQCNVSESESVSHTFDKIKAMWGVPTVCINCAGIIGAGFMVGKDGPMALDFFKKVIDVNLVGTFNVCRFFAAHIINEVSGSQSETNADKKSDSENSDSESEEKGIIINTASIAAFEGQIGQVAYSASKGGVAAMTLPMARELAKWGIRVMTIAPGILDTPMIRSMPEKVQNSLNASTVFPKRLGKPEEYALMVMQIIQNPLLNGSVIRLDGGIRLAAK